MLSGVGQLAVITKNLNATAFGQNIFFPGLFVDFQYNLETTSKEAKAWIEGRKKTVASAIGEETYTLTLSYEYLDWSHLGFAYDEIPQSSSNVPLPIIKTGTVPSSAPYEVADAEISVTNGSSIKIHISERGGWGEAGYRKKAATLTPASGEFAVDTTAKKLIFHSSDAGAPFQYVIEKTYTSLPSIGYEATANSYGALSFIGKGYGPQFANGVYIYLPTITRQKAPSLQTNDVPVFEMEFGCAVPAGKRVPHQFFLL